MNLFNINKTSSPKKKQGKIRQYIYPCGIKLTNEMFFRVGLDNRVFKINQMSADSMYCTVYKIHPTNKIEKSRDWYNFKVFESSAIYGRLSISYSIDDFNYNKF